MRAVVVASFAVLAIAVPVHAQDAPPADLARVESARSRACVGALGRLGDLQMRLEPIAQGANRLRQLNQAIALEDSTQAAPFAASDPVETAVREWFVQDQALGRRYAETQDSALVAERDRAREAIRARLTEAMDGLRAAAEREGAEAQQIEAAAAPCAGAVLVRPVVLEECRASSTKSQLCEAAADTTRGGLFRFVEAPEDLWDVEELRPWSDPGPLQVTPQGQLAGARTASSSRLGNITVGVGLSPMIRERAQTDSAQAAEFDANLDSLGFTFDDPRFVMAPALELQARLPAPIGGETHYLLHFGDVGAPDVVWSAPAGDGGVLQALVPLSPADLALLGRGEQLSFTAVKVGAPPAEGETPQGEFVFSLALTPVGQARAVSGLVDYMAHGGLAADLARIVPPAG